MKDGQAGDILANPLFTRTLKLKFITNSTHTTMASQEVPKTCRVILSDTIAKKLLAEARETLVKVQGPNAKKPTLAAFLATDDPAAAQYADWSKKTCEEK